MTTFNLTLGTDRDRMDIWILDASIAPIDLATVSDANPVFLPWRESIDHWLQIGSLSADIDLVRSGDILPWRLDCPWQEGEDITIEAGMGSCTYALRLSRDANGTRAKATITKIDALKIDQPTDPGRSSPVQGNPGWLREAASVERVRDAFLEAAAMLEAARIALSPAAAETLAALANLDHGPAVAPTKRVELEREVVTKLALEGPPAKHKPGRLR
ncbi:hypothetical protein [Paraliomyxa miuraensis]|uniref:hypothetical protein n=1 Tax=Paraliomyxa miuraensis TaxID=376150 RepID=UPI00225782E7|nr:hypothetical protein [Paraliomyxa miuraensis]MCX4247790.1 hypothetical protein [Paraliomyxa miuraensis]